MGSKKAKSTLPDELNENWGSNYMMDGFWYDMEYGHGLREDPPADPVPQPSTSGFAQLPDGLIMGTDAIELHESPENVEQEEEGAMDLGVLGIVAAVDPDVDRSDAGITDFSWLADAEQELDRLPNQPVDNGIPELQEAWGDRTDGIHRIELYDRSETRYEDSQQGKEDDDTLHRDKLAGLVRAAMRRSAAAESMASIKEDLIAQLGPRVAQKIAYPVRAIEAEHGLVGNVYVRASAYPALHVGRYGDALKKVAKGARYLVACEGCDCTTCGHVLGLSVVNHPDEIDWNDAYEHYAPALEATGRLDRMATVIDKRETLRRAFLAHEEAPRLAIETTKVRPTMPVDGVTSEEARRTVAEFRPPQRAVLSLAKRWKASDAKKVVTKIGQMVKAHLVTAEEADRLIASKAPPQEILKAAARIALTVKTSRYSGGEPEVRGEKLTKEAAWEGLRKAAAQSSEDDQAMWRRNAKDRIKQAVRLIEAQINGGMKGKRLAAFIRETLPSRVDALAARELLLPVLEKTGALNPKAPERREYSDARFTKHVASASGAGVPEGDVRKAVRWVGQQMSEGFAGKQLDDLIQMRFSPRVASAAQAQIDQERGTHEGLSGHLYVPAASYASAEGTTGCEEGSLRHRTNGLKFVLAMGRCDGCVFRNADAVCQKYNKHVIDEVPSDVADRARRQNIASHQMTDQEQTAALFATGVEAAEVATEFGLHNTVLEDVETEAPEHGILDGIFFQCFLNHIENEAVCSVSDSMDIKLIAFSQGINRD